MEETSVNKHTHFPHCDTFEKDPISAKYYCIKCGVPEENVDAYYEEYENYGK